MKLCIVDIDDVIANPSQRRSKALDAKTAYFQQHLNEGDPEKVKKIVKEAESEFYRVLFTPELVALDTLMPDVTEILDTLAQLDWQILFLTSRPESMRDATIKWLAQHGIEIVPVGAGVAGQDWLVMCATAFRNGYTKTTILKSGLVETFAHLFGVTELIFVDDNENNCNAVENIKDGLSKRCELALCNSLDQAATTAATWV